VVDSLPVYVTGRVVRPERGFLICGCSRGSRVLVLAQRRLGRHPVKVETNPLRYTDVAGCGQALVAFGVRARRLLDG